MKYRIIKSLAVAVAASLSVHLLRNGRRFSPLSLIMSIIVAFAGNMALYEILDRLDKEDDDIEVLE